MAESRTPLAGQLLQDRPLKRSRVDSPSTGNGPVDDAIDRLVNDDQLPSHLKTVLAHLMERTSSVEVLLKKNHELEERLKAELAEKSKLREEIEVLKSALSRSRISSPTQPRVTPSSSPRVQNSYTPLASSFCEVKERLRRYCRFGKCLESFGVFCKNIKSMRCSRNYFNSGGLPHRCLKPTSMSA
ncbi:hypothetical protein Y032_0791g2372 [Ancylostoma ceylanicum]|uniref:Uncharacterized protein n=1 Tax=Ancylostoma ceylanicum TaxID=53326 RepID=A0A016WDT4_9BILA|nr:hypothetical protein Y032_0791g2372 [Ancylostoma ceylanicum]